MSKPCDRETSRRRARPGHLRNSNKLAVFSKFKEPILPLDHCDAYPPPPAPPSSRAHPRARTCVDLHSGQHTGGAPLLGFSGFISGVTWWRLVILTCMRVQVHRHFFGLSDRAAGESKRRHRGASRPRGWTRRVAAHTWTALHVLAAWRGSPWRQWRRPLPVCAPVVHGWPSRIGET